MKCVKCGQEIMEGAAFCSFCGAKTAAGQQEEDRPIYQAEVKGMRKTGRLTVYRDRTEFATSSVQKTVYSYSSLVAVKKRLGLGMDHIDFITEDGRTESCDVNRKNVHEAFLYIEKAAASYIDERKSRLLSQGIRYSVVSSAGLTDGILNISDSMAEFRSKSGQSEIVSFQDVKSVRGFRGIKSEMLEFSLYDGRTRAFGIDKEIQEQVLSFVREALVPYIQERKEALLAKGIYFSCLSSYGPDGGELNIFEDRAEFVGKTGRRETVFFKDVRTAGLFTEVLELSLTNGTSRSFGVEKDVQEEILDFVKKAIQPYVLKRTAGFDMVFGIDERIEVNDERGVFHILRQGGNEITEECSLAALVRCEQTECRDSGGVLDKGIDIFTHAASAVGAQNASNGEDKISYVGVSLTIRTEQGEQREIIRFGDFFVRMRRDNEKYGRYLAEASKFMDYLGSRCPECELILSELPEPEKETAGGGRTAVAAIGCKEAADTSDADGSMGEAAGAAAVSEKDQLGITKYVEGVSSFISSCRAPMTIAIQGRWGSGRNSIMRMLFDSLEGTYPEERIWIDARSLIQAGTEDSLPVFVGKRLIGQISSAESGGSKERAVKITKSIFELVTGIVASDSQVGRNLAEELFKDGSEIPPEKLVDVFSRLVKERAGEEDGKVIILINDLDRLVPAKAVELLEALRDYFECEGCVFIASADYSFFLQGVKDYPGLNLDEQQGKELFDEMFQMSFRVPASGYDIQNYVRDKLEHMGICAGDESEFAFYVELIRHSVGGEPKRMDRLFNAFLLLKNMADRELYENRIQRLMLFALLCMQTRFHSVYDRLKQMKDRVTPELLSGLCGRDSEVVSHSGLGGEEQEEFCSFARVLCDMINTDHMEGISPAECGVFAQVLEFSSITSK